MDLSIIEDLRQRAIGFNKGTLFTNCTYGRLFVRGPRSVAKKEKSRGHGEIWLEVGGALRLRLEAKTSRQRAESELRIAECGLRNAEGIEQRA